MLAFLKKIIGGGSNTDYKMLLSQGAIIVDVRTPAEFSGGHIKNAINIPLDQLKNKVAELKKKNKIIITCCRSGTRSAMAKSVLASAGLECYNGGGWNALENKII
ncbi:MAG: rhodanese-like domain-containing protein [Chitinophagaceae bacterium]|nr:rhodanese-like domain-containing protein [Chitinophagaceae bacterium]